MGIANPRRPVATAAVFRLAPQLFLASLAGLMLAVLAFSQAAASTGIRIDTFRPLGGSFFSWRSGQRTLAIDLYENRKKVDAERFIASGRLGLSHAPLSARSLWMVGMGFQERRNLGRARRAMLRASRITRRDAAVQLWLAEDAFRRERIAEGLRHYDLIIRSEPAASAKILPRLAAIMVQPEGRRYLLPYVGENNPWYTPLLRTAVDTLPKANPVGRLLIEKGGKAPDIEELDPVYAKLVARLVDEGAQDVALRLYPRLPDGNAAVLNNVSGIVDGKLAVGYPPFVWSFANEAYGATLVSLDRGSGMEFYGAPGTIGMAATKLIAPRSLSRIQWRVHDRSPNLQSAAAWVATCISGKAKGAQETSINLLSDAVPLNKTLSMALPANCEVVRLDMRVTGGIGTNPASLIVGNLELTKAAAAD